VRSRLSSCEGTGNVNYVWVWAVACVFNPQASLPSPRIVAVLKNRVVVHSFTTKPQKLSTFETVDNDKGLSFVAVFFSFSPQGISQ